MVLIAKCMATKKQASKYISKWRWIKTLNTKLKKEKQTESIVPFTEQ